MEGSLSKAMSISFKEIIKSVLLAMSVAGISQLITEFELRQIYEPFIIFSLDCLRRFLMDTRTNEASRHDQAGEKQNLQPGSDPTDS